MIRYTPFRSREQACREGSVAVLLGNGDGPFHVGQTISAGAIGTRIVKADFSHDGNPDLAVLARTNSQAMILLGKSDGSFPFNSGARAPSTGPFDPGSNPTPIAASGSLNHGERLAEFAREDLRKHRENFVVENAVIGQQVV